MTYVIGFLIYCVGFLCGCLTASFMIVGKKDDEQEEK